MPPVKVLTEISHRLYFSFVENVVVAATSRLYPDMYEIISVRTRRIYYRIAKKDFPYDLESFIVDRQTVLPSKKR